MGLKSSVTEYNVGAKPLDDVLVSTLMFIVVIGYMTSRPIPLIINATAVNKIKVSVVFPWWSSVSPPFITATPVTFVTSVNRPPPATVGGSRTSSTCYFGPTSVVASINSRLAPLGARCSVPDSSGVSRACLAFPGLAVGSSIAVDTFLPGPTEDNFTFSDTFSPWAVLPNVVGLFPVGGCLFRVTVTGCGCVLSLPPFLFGNAGCGGVATWIIRFGVLHNTT